MTDTNELQNSCIEFAKTLIAGGAKWKDSTSYQRGDQQRIPTSFNTKVGVCNIIITCGHINYRPEWIFHCFELGFNTTYMGAGLSAIQAAEKAINVCSNKVFVLHKSFSELQLNQSQTDAV